MNDNWKKDLELLSEQIIGVGERLFNQSLANRGRFVCFKIFINVKLRRSVMVLIESASNRHDVTWTVVDC